MYTAAAAALCAVLLSGCEGTSAAFFVSGSGKEAGQDGGTADESDGSYGAEADAGREPETSRPLEKETMPQIDYEALENWFGDGSSGGGSGSGDASDPAGMENLAIRTVTAAGVPMAPAAEIPAPAKASPVPTPLAPARSPCGIKMCSPAW